MGHPFLAEGRGTKTKRMWVPVAVCLPLGELAVFAVEEIADGFAASFVRFGDALALVGIHVAALGLRILRIVSTALGTAVGETGFVRLQFKLF